MRDRDDGEAVDELAHHRRTVVSQPEMLPPRQPLPEVEQEDVAELRREVGDHGGRDCAHRELANPVEGEAVLARVRQARLGAELGDGR